MADPRIGTFVTAAGRRVHLHAAGGGAPVVVLHGWSSIGEEVLPAFLPLADRCRLIVPDRPGYGFSDPLPEGGRGPEAQARWLGDLLDALGIGRAAIVAHSFGAATALAFTAAHPERVSGLTLVAGFCRPTPHAGLPILKMALSPVVGQMLRGMLVPSIAPYVGPWFMEACFRPNGVPAYLSDFPYRHVARPESLSTMAEEILSFSAALDAAAVPIAGYAGPVSAIYGATDLVAEPGWHLPHLQRCCPRRRRPCWMAWDTRPIMPRRPWSTRAVAGSRPETDRCLTVWWRFVTFPYR